MVLNGDSTHPNPYRGPVPGSWGYHPHRIYKGFPDSLQDHFNHPKPPVYNYLADTPFKWMLYNATKKGLVFGRRTMERGLSRSLVNWFNHFRLLLGRLRHRPFQARGGDQEAGARQVGILRHAMHE